jgi:hypothetical protein
MEFAVARLLHELICLVHNRNHEQVNLLLLARVHFDNLAAQEFVPHCPLLPQTLLIFTRDNFRLPYPARVFRYDDLP